LPSFILSFTSSCPSLFTTFIVHSPSQCPLIPPHYPPFFFCPSSVTFLSVLSKTHLRKQKNKLSHLTRHTTKKASLNTLSTAEGLGMTFSFAHTAASLLSFCALKVILFLAAIQLYQETYKQTSGYTLS
jgi:hypothetical protein